MPNERLLVVDDEPAVRRFLKVTLTAQGYNVTEAVNGQEALDKAQTAKPQVIILDIGLPDIDGVEVTRLLRQWTDIPIIILSVRDSESDKIAALDAGADDYLTKPFSVGELLARLRAALRRTSQQPGSPVIVIGDLKMDLASRITTMSSREIQLTPTEYELLHVMIKHAGKVLTHRHLLQEVWGPEYGDELHMLHVNISNLRRKIELEPNHPRYIITEPGVGYRLKNE
jgi:two-component system, OmpR family, KDP operon response regulator KdpE